MTKSDDYLFIPDPYPTKCYCWGSGVSSCTLGVGSGKISLRPRQIKVRSDSSIVAAATGYHRSTAISHDGTCYSWGKPPLGRKTSTIVSEATPKRISIDVPIKKAFHGEKHSVLLANDGSVYCYGDATDGKLGLSKRTRHAIVPSKVLLKKKCRDVSCGFAYTALLMDDNSLCYFGSTGMSKNTNDLDERRSNSPNLHCFPKTLISISSGTSHLAAISSEGECYTWGLSQYGRLGHELESEDSIDFIQKSPKRVDFFAKNEIQTVQACCGGAHTCVISKDGKVYAFGWNIYGQCGMGPDDIISPIEVYLQGKNIVDISCGFAHNAAIDVMGNLIVWGFNEEGQCGIGLEENVYKPAFVDFDENPLQQEYSVLASAGKTHTVCVRSNCPPYEFKRRLNEMYDKKNAVAVISRFKDRILLAVRKERMVQARICKEKTSEPILSTHSKTSETAENTESDSFVSSNLSFVSDVETKSIPEKDDAVNKSVDECILRIKENEYMKLEDEMSRHWNVSRKECFQELSRKRTRIVAEITRRYESYCMTKEDRYSRAFLISKVEQKIEQDKMKLRQIISSRDAKKNFSIRKEAERMLKARQKPVQITKQRKKSKFAARSKKSSRRPLPENDGGLSNNIENLHLPAFNNSIRNKNLLMRRERRLLRHENEQQQELERNAQHLAEEEKKGWSLQLLMKSRISSHLKEMDKIFNTTKLNNAKNLHQIQKSIDDFHASDESNCEKIYRAKSVAEWSKDLAL